MWTPPPSNTHILWRSKIPLRFTFSTVNYSFFLRQYNFPAHISQCGRGLVECLFDFRRLAATPVLLTPEPWSSKWPNILKNQNSQYIPQVSVPYHEMFVSFFVSLFPPASFSPPGQYSVKLSALFSKVFAPYTALSSKCNLSMCALNKHCICLECGIQFANLRQSKLKSSTVQNALSRYYRLLCHTPKWRFTGTTITLTKNCWTSNIWDCHYYYIIPQKIGGIENDFLK